MVRVVVVVQARMDSTRLPGKALASIEGRPLFAWTTAALLAIPSVDAVVLATTVDRSDDVLVEEVRRRFGTDVVVSRGSVNDVLGRCVDAVRALQPAVVVRATADNPFVDPDVVAAQIALREAADLDYVGARGWPLGIPAEVARFSSLVTADAESTDPAEREHVMPFLYSRPERFCIGHLTTTRNWVHGRYTVDTQVDLAFVREVSRHLSDAQPARVGELDEVVAAHPELARLNADAAQLDWRTANLR